MKSFLSGLLALLSSFGLTACTSQPSASTAIRIRWDNDPQTLDPLLAKASQATEVINLLHCSLLASDYHNRRYVPSLAESLPIVSHRGALALLTYTLRPEATWDNGQPVLARDVAFTLKVFNCPGLPTEYVRTQYGFILDIELDENNPRRFTLVCRNASQDVINASGDYLILPEYSLDPQGQLRSIPLPLLRTNTLAALRRYPELRKFAQRYRNSSPEKQPGCGPYTLTAWAKNRYLRLERKANWWAHNIPNAPRWLQAHAAFLDYRVIPDKSTALLALRRGDIDLYPMPPAPDFNRRKQSADTVKFSFQTADSYDMTVVGFNTQRPALRDARTRRALSMLFDVPGLLLATQPGLAYRSVSIINPQDKLAYNDSLPLLPFEPQAAVKLLRQAGWQQKADGAWWQGENQQLTLGITYLTGDAAFEAIALQFQAAAKQIGVTIKLQPRDNGLLQQQLLEGNMDLYVRTLSGSPFSYNFIPILHSRGIGIMNHPRFQNAKSDQLMEAVVAESSRPRQARLLRRFQSLLRQESPLVVLYFARYRLIASRRLGMVPAISMRPGYDAMGLELASSTGQ